MKNLVNEEEAIFQLQSKNNDIKELKRNLNDDFCRNPQSAKKFYDEPSRKIGNWLSENDNYYRICSTDSKFNTYLKNNNFENFDLESLYDPELIRENEELKRSLTEIKSKFVETVQNKDNIIKKLNIELNGTIENCEKMIIEAEENYKKLKKQVNLYF